MPSTDRSVISPDEEANVNFELIYLENLRQGLSCERRVQPIMLFSAMTILYALYFWLQPFTFNLKLHVDFFLCADEKIIEQH